jgi:hypothetical protein
MKRQLCVAFATIAIVAWFATSESDGQQNAENPDAVTIRQLLQQRYDVLKQRYDAVLQRHENGTLHSVHVIPVFDDLLKAKQELAVTKREQIEVCNERVENLRKGEEIAESRYKTGQGLLEDRALATAARIHAEIECLRLKSAPE